MNGRPSSLTQLSRSALVVAAVVFTWSTITAIRTTATDPQSPAASHTDSTSAAGVRTPLNEQDIERAVAHDLFSSLRQSPSRRYTLDLARAVLSDDESDVTTVTTDEPAPILPTVHGTAVSGNGGGFAMCSTGSEPVRVVRVGDDIGDFTVVMIERTRVVFRDPSGHRVTVDALPSPAGDER